MVLEGLYTPQNVKKNSLFAISMISKKSGNRTNPVSPIVLWYHRKPDTDTETEKDPQLLSSHG